MSATGLRARLKRIEANRHQPAMIIVNPYRFPCDPAMTQDELEAHREAVREVAKNPKGIMLTYWNEESGTEDPLVTLLGQEEADAINRKQKRVRVRRIYV